MKKYFLLIILFCSLTSMLYALAHLQTIHIPTETFNGKSGYLVLVNEDAIIDFEEYTIDQ